MTTTRRLARVGATTTWALEAQREPAGPEAVTMYRLKVPVLVPVACGARNETTKWVLGDPRLGTSLTVED